MDRLIAMQVFIEVAQTGSFTEAAQHLDMSRTMVTRYVAELEQWLGAALLQRTTRSVTLTHAGEQALHYCSQLVDISQDLTQAVMPSQGTLRGQLRITCSMSLAYAYVVVVLHEFLALHPALSIDLVASDTAEKLVEQRIDLAIRISSEPDLGLIARPLGICDSVLVAAPAYLAQYGVPQTPHDLKQHKCLGYMNFGRSIWYLTKQGQTEAINIVTPLAANEATILLQATLAGAGIALQPLYLVHEALKEGTLQVVLPDWSPEPMQIQALYTSRRHLAPAIRALLDYLVERFKQAPWLAVNTQSH
ncbi:LysR family transcriptional regulator [Thiofilum flexile]|uniref:LysR family transcriptional regulator n=1 Tax=Thiofilum flexile TaxID=125627 RepID=UPI00036D802D|nr:LysR family transcriptional regulator [Thiofilum flexile]